MYETIVLYDKALTIYLNNTKEFMKKNLAKVRNHSLAVSEAIAAIPKYESLLKETADSVEKAIASTNLSEQDRKEAIIHAELFHKEVEQAMREEKALIERIIKEDGAGKELLVTNVAESSG